MKIRIKNLARINLFDLEIVLIYLIFLKPAIVESIAVLDFIFNMLRFGMTIVFSVLFFCRKRKMSRAWYVLLGILCVVLISTFFYGGRISVVLAHYVPTLGLIAWLDLHRTNLNKIFKVFLSIAGILIWVNLITIVVFPNGILMREYIPIWLLGQKQDYVACAFSAIIFAGICSFKKLLSRKMIMLILLGIAISLFSLESIGLIVTCFIVFILFAIEKIRKKTFSIYFLFLVNILAEIFIVGITHMYENMTDLQNFLGGISAIGLSKNTTMGIRVSMWEYALKMFLENPLLGVGQVTEEFWYQTSSLPFYHTIVHNLFLDIAFKGGIVAVGLFVILNMSAVKKMRTSWENPEVRFIGICFFAMNILQLIECTYSPMVLLIYFLPDWISIIKNDGGVINDKKIIN